MSTTIILADDHGMIREGLRSIIERDPTLKVVGEAGDGRTTVDLVGRLAPDVVVMDIGMPDLNGIEATRQVLAAKSSIRVIGLSGYADSRYVLGMLEAGACGYVLKVSAGAELVQAIHTVVNGRTYLSPEIAGVVVNSYIRRQFPTESTAFALLAPREREVLQLLAEGKSSKEIATRLDVSTMTVETHRRNIMKKLDIHSVAQLTKFAVREGLTSL